MTPRVRGLALVGILALACFAGWRVYALMQAERFAESEPERSLGWHRGNPQALLNRALLQMEQDDPASAQDTARNLLAREPLEGRAFRVLGEAASRQGRQDVALKLYSIAARRAPRDIPARAWLARHYLEQRDFPRALAHIDFVLRTTPDRSRGIYRILRELAPLVQDEGFADALATMLLTSPPWRDDMLRLTGGFPDANSRILENLRKRGALSQDEYAAWLDGLMSQGRWGEAYARWANDAVALGGRLPLLYNGDFSHVPSDIGFDWRAKEVDGVSAEYAAAAGEKGGAAHLQFLGRPFADAGLRHPLFLFPGNYRLDMRMRAQGLHTGLILHWRLDCQGRAGVLADGGPLDGSYDWVNTSVDFTVPPANCPGQVLHLVNPAEKGSEQRVEGALWIDDVAIRRLDTQ